MEMTEDITIPPEALEAAEEAHSNWKSTYPLKDAMIAMLKAWPRSYSLAENDSAVLRDVAAIILPLPKETSA